MNPSAMSGLFEFHVLLWQLNHPLVFCWDADVTQNKQHRHGSQQHVMGKQKNQNQTNHCYSSFFWGRKWQHQWHHANMDDRWARCMIMPFYKLNKNLCSFQQNRKQTTQTDRTNNKSDNPKNNSKSNVTNNTTTAAKNKKTNQPGYRSLFVSHLAFCSRLKRCPPLCDFIESTSFITFCFRKNQACPPCLTTFLFTHRKPGNLLKAASIQVPRPLKTTTVGE